MLNRSFIDAAMHAGSFQVSDIVQYKNIWSNMIVSKYSWGIMLV